jgi:hypothetical protein
MLRIGESSVLPATIQIEILNWDKFNPRKDVKSTSWFRKENNIFENPDFFEFDHSELCFWDYLLSIASKKQSPTISVNLAHASKIGRFQKSTIQSGLEKLQSLQCVRVDSGYEHVDVTHTSRTRHATNERTDTHVDVTDVTIPAPEVAIRVREPDEKSLGSKIWETYSEAYEARWKFKPIRNAKSNSLCSQLAKRLGADAIEVTKFYLNHNDGWYIKNQHDLGSFVSKCEGLHTQWQRGQAITGQQVRTFEKQSVNMDLLAKVRNGEA